MKNVLITGSSRGIGKATADLFEKKNYKVWKPDRTELELGNAVSISAFIDKYKDVYFDAIINNAGINDINLVEDIKDTEIENTVNINLIAPIKLIRGFVGNMKKQNYGRIVNIGSIWGVVSKEGRLTYSASKNGIHGVTNTLAVELGKYNILVNTVCPGFTLTELTYKNNTTGQIDNIAQTIPLCRMAEPIEIAKVIYYLASEENTYITGQKIAVDGGFTAK